MVRREKIRIGASASKGRGKMKEKNKRSPVVKKEGRVEERSERISSSSPRCSQGEERTRPEQPRLSSKKAAITPLQVGSRTRSDRPPQLYDYLQRRSRVRSEGGGALFRTMSNQDRQTFLGPLEFPLLPLEPSDTDNTEAKESQEREAILGPLEFPSPTLKSAYSEDSDWVGRINSIVNPSKASETIGKNDNPVLLPSDAPPSDADWSPMSVPVTDVDDKNNNNNNNNRSGCSGSSINLPFDVFKSIFSGCYPVEHEPDVSRTNVSPGVLMPPWKYEHFLTAPDRIREQACVDPLDYSILFQSTGTDLSYNNTDLDDSTMVTREALTFQTTLLSTFTGTNLSETIVDDGSDQPTLDSLQLKIKRMSESVRQGLDNLAEETMPISSSPPITKTSVTPTPDWSSRLDNSAEKTMPISSSTPIAATSVAQTSGWSSGPDNLAEKTMPISSSPPITRTPDTPTTDLPSRPDNLAEKTMPISSSSPITATSVIPTTPDWPSPAAKTSRVHFMRSVGSAIRRRDMDASRLQMEINRLRAKVESAKLKEQGELRTACNTRQDNQIRSAPLSEEEAATKTNNSSTLHLDQNSRSSSVMIRVPCDWLDE